MQTTHARKPFPTHIVVFLAPAVIIYTIFMVYPLLNSLRLSFFSVSDQKVETYIGLQNYITLLTNPDNSKSFWNAFQNNLVFFAIHMLVQNPIGLLLAALLASGGWGRRFYRTALFMPTVLSVVIIGFIWQLILNPLWGVAESMLKFVHLGFLFKPWLGLPATALTTVSLISVWQFVGIPMILFYTALIGIPDELVEAAHVDGASGWQRFRHVTMPMISPTTFFLFLLQTIGAFQLFTEPFVMTRGGPAQSSMPVVQYIYENAFSYMRMGKASAIAWFLFIFIFGFTLVQNLMQRRWVYYETE